MLSLVPVVARRLDRVGHRARTRERRADALHNRRNRSARDAECARAERQVCTRTRPTGSPRSRSYSARKARRRFTLAARWERDHRDRRELPVPDGSFAVTDAGTLDLGLVRDSALNATNDAMFFLRESWECIVPKVIESFMIESALCDSGVGAIDVADAYCGAS